MNDQKSKAVRVVESILYELQPFRLIDVINSINYIRATGHELGLASITLSDFAYQSAYNFISSLSLKSWACGVFWISGLLFMNYVGFGSLWILLSMFASIFLNLGERKRGEMSAYSVFNEGFKQLLGTMNAEQFDNEIRHHGFQREDRQDNNELVGDSDSDDDLVHPRPNNLNRRARQRRLAALQNNNNNNNAHDNNNMNAAANQNVNNAAENDHQNNNINHNNVRRKGKKGRRNYEERLLRREAAALLREPDDPGFLFDEAFLDGNL